MVILAASGVAALIAYGTVRGQAAQLQSQITVHLQAGQKELEAARSSLTAANSKRDPALIDETSVHFTSAKVQFMVARQIADGSNLLRRLETLPQVGGTARSRHVAVDAISDMGVAISDGGLELTKLDAQLIKPATKGGQQGHTLLTVLEQTNTSLLVVRADLARAQEAAARVDIRVLPAAQQPGFLKARATINSALATSDEFQRLVPVLTELLGGNGPRTYLIEQVNPSELRPGGGFIGTFSVLRVDHGTILLIQSGASELLSLPRAAAGHAGYVEPPGPIREFIPNTSWSFFDSNFFPDFPSNAKAGESFAQPKLAANLDAVISIDYYTVAKMLELTGPISLSAFGVTVDANNFVPLVVKYDINPIYDAIHKAVLQAVAGPLMERISTLPPDRWPALIGALNELSTARHLQAYFNNASVQKEIDQVGWSGTVNPNGARDYMMEVESNLGGTKANYFVVRHFTVELTRSGATLHHKVIIDIQDNMPYSFRPDEYYSAYLRLYVSGAASSTSHNLRPAKYANPAPPTGTRLIDGWVPLFHGYGHTGKAVFEYDTPWQVGGRGEHQIYWQKQPGTLNDKFEVIWHDGGGRTYNASGDLGQDRVVTVSTKGITVSAGRPGQAQLPSLGLG